MPMTGLVFKKLWILSKLEKAGRTLELKPGLNLLTGENDVGKSTLIKSLYHSIGADVPQMDNTLWKRARAVYCSNIVLNGIEYYVVRDGKHFGVFDANKQFISRHSGIATDKGIAHFLCAKLNFQIELQRSKDTTLGIAGPAFYFLPFYVDQDSGWSTSWSSFTGLQQFSAYRKNMIEYHLGVRPQSYYNAKKKQLQLNDQLNQLIAERHTLENVKAAYRKRKFNRQVDLDPSVFRADLEELVDQYNVVYGRQQVVLRSLKEVRNERNSIDTDLGILRTAIAELDADYEFAAAPDRPEHIDCPTCGTGISNTFADRFGILDDIEYCESLLDQRMKDRMAVQERLTDIEEDYSSVSNELSSADELMKREKENVTLADLIKSEGIKELLESISEEIVGFEEREADISKSIGKLDVDLKLDGAQKKLILEYYQARMKQYLNELNVQVLEDADYTRLDQVIKNNALGSDLPRSLLAQYFAYLQTMNKFNQATICPMIIDSPKQQEQDDTNIDAIFKFIFGRTLQDQQLILGTISIESLSAGIAPEDLNHIVLTEKFKVLQKDQFASVSDDIGEMHTEMLASE
ncbi:MAG: AAA family ATPase [Hyphomicrobiales bacterium]